MGNFWWSVSQQGLLAEDSRLQDRKASMEVAGVLLPLWSHQWPPLPLSQSLVKSQRPPPPMNKTSIDLAKHGSLRWYLHFYNIYSGRNPLPSLSPQHMYNVYNFFSESSVFIFSSCSDSPILASPLQIALYQMLFKCCQGGGVPPSQGHLKMRKVLV